MLDLSSMRFYAGESLVCAVLSVELIVLQQYIVVPTETDSACTTARSQVGHSQCIG